MPIPRAGNSIVLLGEYETHLPGSGRGGFFLRHAVGERGSKMRLRRWTPAQRDLAGCPEISGSPLHGP